MRMPCSVDEKNASDAIVRKLLTLIRPLQESAGRRRRCRMQGWLRDEPSLFAAQTTGSASQPQKNASVTGMRGRCA